jgi:hypothetical protein
MHGFAFERRTPDERLRPGLYCRSLLDFAIGRRQPETDGKAVDIVFLKKDADLFGRTQSRRGFCNELQYLLQIENRPADNLEHIARCGLVFERCFEFVGALPQFSQQPRVLDGDHGLRSEVGHELDLLVVERTDRR